MAILTKLTIEFCRIKVVKRIIHFLLILSRETNLYPVVNTFPTETYYILKPFVSETLFHTKCLLTEYTQLRC